MYMRFFVGEHIETRVITERTLDGKLNGITMRLNPGDAIGIYRALIDELVPVLAWRNSDLYRWARRRTAAARGEA